MQISQRQVTRPKLDVERVELPNGLVLLLSENHSTPAVSINAVVRAGSRYEGDEKAGLAFLVGDLLDAGTTGRTSRQIAETIEAAGGRLATAGNYQSSSVAICLLSKDTSLGLDVVSDLLLNATFPEEKVQQHVSRQVARIKARLDSPRTQASDAFNEVVFKGAPQHRPSIGYEETAAALTRDNVEAFYRRYYVPDNTLLAIAGDFDMSELKSKAEAMFGGWERSGVFNPPSIARPQRQTSSIDRFINASKEQVNIIIGHVGVERRNPDYYALTVMDTILGSSPGFTSRIPRILRDELGLAYSTFSNITGSAGLDLGRFVAYIGTAPENLDRAISGLRGEIRRIVEEPVTDRELEIAKSYLTGSFVLRFQKNAQIAQFLVEAEVYGLGFDFLDRYAGLINAITVDDVTRVARTYIDPLNLTTVVVGQIAGRMTMERDS